MNNTSIYMQALKRRKSDFHQFLPILSLAFIFLFGSSMHAFAATKSFAGPGNFGDATKWTGNSLPAAGDDLRINGICTIDNNALTNNIAYGSLLIGNTLVGTLGWISAGTNRLNVASISSSVAGSTLNMANGGILVLKGTISLANLTFTPGIGSVEAQLGSTNLNAFTTYNNLVINTTGTVSTGINLTVNGNLTVTSGTLNVGAFNLLVTGTTTVNGTLTITSIIGTKSFGNLVVNGTFNNTATNVPVSITGNFQNNGTYNGGTGMATFTGASSTTISGTAATTAFNGGLTVNKGTSTASILDVQSNITFPASTLTITNGTFKLSSASTLQISAAAINPTQGIWNNGGTMNFPAGTVMNVFGLLRSSAGVMNVGVNADDRIEARAGGLIVIDGGTINVAARIGRALNPDYNFTMSGGTLNLNTVGSTVTNLAPFHLTGASTFNMSGGTIVIHQGGGSNLGFNVQTTGAVTVTGGTLQIGDATTPAGEIINITSNVPVWNLTVNGSNSPVAFLTTALTIKNNVTLTSGTLNVNNLNITVGGSWINNSSFTAGSARVTFNGAGMHTITGSATTAFNTITINKGTDFTSNILDVQSLITMATGGLTLTNGTFKLSSNSTIHPFTTDIPNFPYRIPNAAGLWCNGGVINTDDDCTTDGLLRISNGIFNLGSAADNRLRTVNCLLTVDGGALNIAGRITPTTATDNCTFVMSAGTIRVATIGSGGSIVKAPFDMTGTSSSFTMSGGTIIVMEEGGAGPQNMGFKLTPGISNVTGGTIQMGDASTPSGSTMNFFSSVPLYNLVINSANVTVVLDSFPVTTFKNNVTITAGILNTDGLDMIVGGNWTNNATFLPTTGKVTFNGTGTKTIGGSSTISFYNLTINTVASADIVQLTKNATTTSVLTLTRGVLDLNSNTIFITNNSNAAIIRTSGNIRSEKTNNSSKVCWSINSNTSAHTFPFATVAGAYIPFIVTRTSGNLGQVTVSTYPTAYLNTPYPTTPILVTNMNSLSGSNNSPNVVDRFWQIDKEGVASTATLTFTATAAEIGTITFPTAQRYESSTDKWDDPLPGQTNPTATSVTVPGVTNFSPWTLSGNGSMLPIELLDFTAVLNATQVDLNWTTAAELNNDYFTIEKTHDLVNYEEVTIVEGAGNSTHLLTYTSADINPYKDVSYYRLKQTDYNGTETYSNVVSVSIDSSPDDFIAYPNPVIGTTINVKLPNEFVNEIQVIIYNMNGQEVFSKKIDANADKSFTVPANRSEKFSSGMYLLTLISETGSYQKKLIVE